MNEAHEQSIDVEAVVDPLPQIEHYRQASQRWRRLALGTVAALAVIFLLSLAQFAATWLALSKLVEAQGEVLRLRDEARADLDHLHKNLLRLTQEANETQIKTVQAGLDLQMMKPSLTRTGQDLNEQLARLDVQDATLEKFNDFVVRLSKEQQELTRLAKVFKTKQFGEAMQQDLNDQLLKARQALDTAQNDIKALVEEAKLQRALLDKNKTDNPFVAPAKP